MAGAQENVESLRNLFLSVSYTGLADDFSDLLATVGTTSGLDTDRFFKALVPIYSAAQADELRLYFGAMLGKGLIDWSERLTPLKVLEISDFIKNNSYSIQDARRCAKLAKAGAILQLLPDEVARRQIFSDMQSTLARLTNKRKEPYEEIEQIFVSTIKMARASAQKAQAEVKAIFPLVTNYRPPDDDVVYKRAAQLFRNRETIADRAVPEILTDQMEKDAVAMFRTRVCDECQREHLSTNQAKDDLKSYVLQRLGVFRKDRDKESFFSFRSLAAAGGEHIAANLPTYDSDDSCFPGAVWTAIDQAPNMDELFAGPAGVRAALGPFFLGPQENVESLRNLFLSVGYRLADDFSDLLATVGTTSGLDTDRFFKALVPIYLAAQADELHLYFSAMFSKGLIDWSERPTPLKVLEISNFIKNNSSSVTIQDMRRSRHDSRDAKRAKTGASADI